MCLTLSCAFSLSLSICVMDLQRVGHGVERGMRRGVMAIPPTPHTPLRMAPRYTHIAVVIVRQLHHTGEGVDPPHLALRFHSADRGELGGACRGGKGTGGDEGKGETSRHASQGLSIYTVSHHVSLSGMRGL